MCKVFNILKASGNLEASPLPLRKTDAPLHSISTVSKQGTDRPVVHSPFLRPAPVVAADACAARRNP